MVSGSGVKEKRRGKKAAASGPKAGKSELREKFRKWRLKLSRQEVKRRSAKILENLFLLREISRAQNVACYISFNNEVSTRAIIEKLRKSGKKVFVPVMDSGNKSFNFAQVKSFEGMKKNSYGILEPAGGKIPPREKIDLFLVPGLAFDLRGARIGWGKGFYDRFFAENKVKGLKIGLAFGFQLLGKIPSGAHDAKMDFVVTEKKIVKV